MKQFSVLVSMPLRLWKCNPLMPFSSIWESSNEMIITITSLGIEAHWVHCIHSEGPSHYKPSSPTLLHQGQVDSLQAVGFQGHPGSCSLWGWKLLIQGIFLSHFLEFKLSTQASITTFTQRKHTPHEVYHPFRTVTLEIAWQGESQDWILYLIKKSLPVEI